MTGPVSHHSLTPRRPAGMCRPSVWCSLGVWLAAVICGASSGPAQQPGGPARQPDGPARQPEPPGARQESDSPDRDRVRELCDVLRSGQFARREVASQQLYDLGRGALPELQQALQSSDDEEQKYRLNHVIERLAEKDLETRIENFLEGGDPELDNWPEFERWFDDTPRARELFVELYRAHPDLVRSLGGSPQQLLLGLSKVRRNLMDRRVGQQEPPQRVDLIALLLPMVEPNVQPGVQYDSIVSIMLQFYPASELRNDRVFGEPFLKLVSRWMTRSDRAVREQVLRMALQWEMDVALELALKTFDEDPSPILLCRVMQAIAKQGDRGHAALIVRHLNDSTIVFQKRYLGQLGGEVQVGDVAAAAIAKLNNVPVTKIGFAEPAEHDVLGIVFEELVVPSEDPANDSAEPDASPSEQGSDQNPRPIRPESIGRQLDIRQLQQEAIEAAQRRETARAAIRQRARELVRTPSEN